MTRIAARLVWAGVTVLTAACTEDVAAPGVCPGYCPSGSIVVIDTMLGSAISRDSSFGRPLGYVNPFSSLFLVAADLPGVRDSRPIFRISPLVLRVPLTADTTTSPVIGVDSLLLHLTITRRDTATHNLALGLYKLPLTMDSTTTFADVAAAFTGSLIRTVNVDSLLAKPGMKDTVRGDSAVVDAVSHRIILVLKLDSAQVPLVLADTGKVAFGLRVSADSLASITLGAVENGGIGPLLNWYVKVDSMGTSVAHRLERRSPTFDTFVFTPPAPPLDVTLAVGGVPSVRSIMRVAFPRGIRDSSQIIRATLELITAVAPHGIAADSFGLVAHAAVIDVGAKSPLDPIHADTTRIYMGTSDTVRIEVTNILQYWGADTLAPTTLMLRQVPEGLDFAEIRFYPSSDAARRPRLRVTYSPRFPFGRP